MSSDVREHYKPKVSYAKREEITGAFQLHKLINEYFPNGFSYDRSEYCPVVIFKIGEGCGYSTMASFLYKKINTTKEHHSNVLEMIFSKSDEFTNNLGTVEKIEEIIKRSVYSRYFPGLCISVDITEYMGVKIYDDYFIKFLKLVSEKKMDNVFFLKISKSSQISDEIMNSSINFISNYLHTYIIDIPEITPRQAFSFVNKNLRKWSLELSAESYEPFCKMMQYYFESKYFYGFKTLKKITEDIFNYNVRLNILKKEIMPEEKPKSINSDPDFVSQSVFNEIYPKNWDKNEKGEGLRELEDLIGLGFVKEQIKEIVKTAGISKDLGLNKGRTLHFMFTGQPGTGKTVVAKLIGKIFKEAGILPTGKLIEVSRKDLIGEYIGQTALKTIDVCKMAIGNVLFIDEAYSLAQGSSTRYGFEQEALSTLIAEMENNRDKFIIIMAGYKEEMESLCKTNPGLRDRFAFVVDFPSYSKEELVKIFTHMLKSKNLICGEDVCLAVENYFKKLPQSMISDKNFSNARFVRNLIERIISKTALRLVNEGSLDGEELDKITLEDFCAAVEDSDFKKLVNGSSKFNIGFRTI